MSFTNLSFTIIALAVFTGCASSSSPAINEDEAVSAESRVMASPPAAAEVTFYVGTSATTSPDGTIPFGPPVTVAVRRTVDPSAGTIHELVVHPGRSFPTTLTRIGGANTFNATDDAKSFTGTLTFEGSEWAWDAWTYDIQMADGSGSLRGRGTRTPLLIETDKTFYDAKGNPSARLREHLERVDEATYVKTRDGLLSPAP